MKTSQAIIDCLSRKNIRINGKPTRRVQLWYIVLHVMEKQLGSSFRYPAHSERADFFASKEYKRYAAAVKSELQVLLANGVIASNKWTIYGSTRYYTPKTKFHLETVRDVEVTVAVVLPPGFAFHPGSSRFVRAQKDFVVKVPNGWKLDTEGVNPRNPSNYSFDGGYLLDHAAELADGRRFIVVKDEPLFEPKFGDIIEVSIDFKDSSCQVFKRIFIAKSSDGFYCTFDWVDSIAGLTTEYASKTAAQIKAPTHNSSWPQARAVKA